MAPTLGKRKRRGAEITSEARPASKEPGSTLKEDAQAVFRRHFESRFKPLPTITKKTVKAVENIHDSDDGDEPEWDGISVGEGILQILTDLHEYPLTSLEDVEVEVIEHTAVQSYPAMSKEELKVFMVGLFVSSCIESAEG